MTRRCSSGSLPSPSLAKIRPTCFSTAASVTLAELGDPQIRLALGHQREDLALTRGQHLERVVLAPPADHQRHDLGIERGAAGGHAAHGIGERADVGNAVLHQIANAARVVADEIHGIRLVAELGEHENAGLRMLAADRERSPQAVVSVVWWHLHVDDRDVWMVRGHLAAQINRVASLSDHFESALGQQPGQSLPQEQLIFRYHHLQRGHRDRPW